MKEIYRRRVKEAEGIISLLRSHREESFNEGRNYEKRKNSLQLKLYVLNNPSLDLRGIEEMIDLSVQEG